MLKTKLQVCDEILQEVYGGPYTNDTTISLAFVCRKLNNRIAEAAVKSAFISNNLDGIVEADDIFRLTYTNLTLSTDTNDGLKYFALPAQPIGLPSNRSFTIYPPAMRGGRASNIFKMINASDVGKTRSLPAIKKVFCFVENGVMKFVDAFQMMSTFTSVNLSVVSSGANDLTAFLNLPDDMVVGIKMLIVPELREMISMQDTTPIPQQDSPKPRQGA